jgi:hypothetical protein
LEIPFGCKRAATFRCIGSQKSKIEVPRAHIDADEQQTSYHQQMDSKSMQMVAVWAEATGWSSANILRQNSRQNASNYVACNNFTNKTNTYQIELSLEAFVAVQKFAASKWSVPCAHGSHESYHRTLRLQQNSAHNQISNEQQCAIKRT